MRERIILAAAQEMNERSVKFTVEAVAARLGISKKTLYQNFSSKQALVSAIMDTVVENMENQIDVILDSDKPFTAKLEALLCVQPDFVDKINDWVISDIERYLPAEWDKLVKHRRRRTQRLREILSQGVEQGQLRPIHVGLASEFCFVVGSQLLNYAFLQRVNVSMDEAFTAFSDVFLNGVLKEKKGNEGEQDDKT